MIGIAAASAISHERRLACLPFNGFVIFLVKHIKLAELDRNSTNNSRTE
jgi:hypothetical protein